VSTVGTWDWAEATGGRLRRRDRADQLRQAVLARLGAMPARWRSTVVPDDGSLVLPDPPDSAVARLAEEHVRGVSTPELYAHCLRTWLFATLFAQRDRVAHDEELLYLACVMHDLGLTDAHDRRDPAAACFAVEGGRAAQALLCEHGTAPDRARAVAEAISLHLNVSVPARLGAEAHLLNKGAALDAVGRGVRRLPHGIVREAINARPRHSFGEHLAAAMSRQARIRPESRAAFLSRLGFAGLVTRNPLDSGRDAAGS
jgi:hypothetical protein